LAVLPSALSELLEAADAVARETAWTAFVQTHSRLLLHTARSLHSDHDAVMDAYAYVLEELRRDDFYRLRAYVADSRARFTTWLVVVARRLCLDRVRQQYGRPQDAGAESHHAHVVRRRLVDLLAEELDSTDVADLAADNPETQLRADELSRALALAVGGLESRDQLLLKLRFEDDLPAREIAQTMGFATPFHVYRRLNGLLDQLRAALARRGVRGPEP
jgi:RNA polymerase sigma factor (sigma-70 family)